MLDPVNLGIATAKVVANEVRNEDTSCERQSYAGKMLSTLAVAAVMPYVPVLPESLSNPLNVRELLQLPMTNQSYLELQDMLTGQKVSAFDETIKSRRDSDLLGINGKPTDSLNPTLEQTSDPGTLREQVAQDSEEIVVERKRLDSKTEAIENGTKTTYYDELTLVDAESLNYRHTVEFFKEISTGNLPSLHLCMLALLDLTDLATAGALKAYLARHELTGHTYKVIQLTEVIETHAITNETAPKVTETKVKDVLDEDRPGLNRRVETVEEKQRTDEVATETNTRQVVISRAPVPLLGTNITTLADLRGITWVDEITGPKLDRLMYAEYEKDAFVKISKLHEEVESTAEKQKESRTLFGRDTSRILGSKEDLVDNSSSIKTTTWREEDVYHSSTHSVKEIQAKQSADTIDDSPGSISHERYQTPKATESQNVANSSDASVTTEFKEGLIGWLPGGSILNLAVKQSMGAEITRSDYFWAAVDVVGTVGTLGAGVALKNVAKVGLKTVAKEVAERGVKEGAEAAGKSAAKKGVQAGLKETAETAGESATKSGAEQVVMSGGKEALDPTEALKPGTRNISGKLDDDVMDTVPKRNAGTIDQADGLDTVKAGPKASSEKLADDVSLVDGPGTNSIRNAPDSMVTKIGDKTITKLDANKIYETPNGMRFRTDHKGRPKEAVGRLEADAVKGNPHTQRMARENGLPGDDGGHLIPKASGGPGDLFNIVPQASEVNRGAIKKIENEARRLVSEGKTVDYNVKVNYPHGETKRPSSFSITVHVDGKFYKDYRIMN